MWARKRLAIALVVAVALVASLLVIFLPDGTKTAVLPAQTYKLTIQNPAGPAAAGKGGYMLAGARTAAEHARGLSDIQAMPADRGMLFIYNSQEQHCFWMKDMRFPIDMIWLDTDKMVTHIEAHVSPASYPNALCYVSKYVIELNAGEAARNNLKAGQTVSF